TRRRAVRAPVARQAGHAATAGRVHGGSARLRRPGWRASRAGRVSARALERLTMTGLPADLPVRHFRDAAAWEDWLATNGDATVIRLKIAKKNSGVVSVSYAQALDVALCHGWIDGLKKSLDANFFLQRFTPRRAKSLWSTINVAKVEALV